MSSRAELPERLRPGTRVPTNPILSMSACLPPTYSTTWINFLLSFPSKITPSLPTSQHATLIRDVSHGLTYCIFSSPALHTASPELKVFHKGDALNEEHLIV